MFALLFWSFAIFALGTALGSFVRLFQRNQITWADCALFIAPFVLWLTLVVVGWRDKTLSNLVELLVLFFILCASIGIRTFALRWGENVQRSVRTFIFGMVCSLLLYALVPVLPE